MNIKSTSYYIFVGAFIFITLLQACHKRVLVVPDACLTADKTEIKKFDTVTFTDCCKAAEKVQLLFYDARFALVEDKSSYDLFDANHHYKKVFTDTGTYTAVIIAFNKEAPAPQAKLSIKIRP